MAATVTGRRTEAGIAIGTAIVNALRGGTEGRAAAAGRVGGPAEVAAVAAGAMIAAIGRWRREWDFETVVFLGLRLSWVVLATATGDDRRTDSLQWLSS